MKLPLHGAVVISPAQRLKVADSSRNFPVAHTPPCFCLPSPPFILTPLPSSSHTCDATRDRPSRPSLQNQEPQGHGGVCRGGRRPSPLPPADLPGHLPECRKRQPEGHLRLSHRGGPKPLDPPKGPQTKPSKCDFSNHGFQYLLSRLPRLNRSRDGSKVAFEERCSNSRRALNAGTIGCTFGTLKN